VLFFELREAAGADPFLLVYLHRGAGEEFSRDAESRFADVHRVFRNGAWLKGGPA